MSKAEQRANMPKGTQAVLDRRTVEHGNSNLLNIVQNGQSVLDVGCGSGSITAGIAKLVGSSGYVVGIDTSPHLIELAKEQYGSVANLHFEVADLYSYKSTQLFDVVSSARVLQWLAHPEKAIEHMVEYMKPKGFLSILDYNHCKIEWNPAPPESMLAFYDAFLKWRGDAGMDNGIADRLAEIFKKQGLNSIIEQDFSEISERQTVSFADDAGIWNKVAETRGQQVVQDGYFEEEVRLQAMEDYSRWINDEGTSMKLYLRAVTGRK